ncbi:hypothetical protein ULVI_08190 [Cochleicola gelatinilyticus]|uniref:Thioredoxin domain-containing protein n=1 Tax=Cochleicola gelatinilyticus TaxID=1763537 RepID=A0A167HFR3_9FLAO|nr:hypothetical protein ULVI_08190 [Cochleicola gelatinilyticus]
MDTIWIGGEIIAPKSDYIILKKDNQTIDTILLERDNTFLYKADTLSEGLYTFHHNEYQIMHLTPGDSLLLRVNTYEFDESLTYSGRGAEKNNFLMDLYLFNEKVNRDMPKLYQLPPREFERELDSIQLIKTTMLKRFKSNHTINDAFEEVALADINYGNYLKKELYTSANYRRKETLDFPASFYDYRDKVNTEKTFLKVYLPYYRFLNAYSDNLAFEKYKASDSFSRYSYQHSYHKLKTIDSLIKSPVLKNALLENNVRRYLNRANNAEEEQEISKLFLKMDTNKSHQYAIQNLVDATLKLTPGNKIPDLTLATVDNNAASLAALIKKPTVLYFWSSQSVNHYKDIHRKAELLQEKFPEYDFIGINTDTNFRKWRDLVTALGYDSSQEFQFENIIEAEKQLVLNSANKTMILDRSGIILTGNTNLFNPNIEKQLKDFKK